MKSSRLSARAFAIALCCALPCAAFSQATSNTDDEVIEEIVVTGTGVQRTVFETPQSVTQFSETDLRKFTGASQADVLTQIPGIKAEGGGGEVATNVFLRGLPSGGQFSFTPLEYDGIPVFTTFGLNSSAFDVYYRNDLGISRVEYVSSGTSNLFGPGSVAGIINYISKTGGPENEGTLQLELAEEGRLRGDYYFSGPLGDDDSNTYYALSGFYRYDEGTLDSDLTTEGYQVRGNLTKEFSDGSGSVTFYGQLIDDSVQFYLPLPLNGLSQERLSGNDGAEVFTVNTGEARGIQFQTPEGQYQSPIGDGVVTEGASFAVVLDKDIGNDWAVNSKIKFAQYDHQFNLFLDGDGVANTVQTQSEFLTSRGLDPFAANADFTFTQSGLALPANYLLFGNRTLDRVRDATDVSGEFSISKGFSRDSSEHTVTIGTFFSQSEALDINYISTFLADFRNAPLFVDVALNDVAQDANGALVASPGDVFQFTQNGLMNANGLTGDHERSARRAAIYIADQIEFGDWTFDVGARIERLDGEVVTKRTGNVVMGSDPLVNDDLEQVSFRTGQIFSDTLDTTEWALSLGALYRLNDSVNLFGNVSRGYFFPQVRSQRFNDFGEFGTFDGEIIIQGEAGLKFQTDRWDGYATAFYTDLSDRQDVTFVNDPNNPGQVITSVEQTSTESVGIEAGAVFHINDYWALNGNITLRSHEFTESEGNPSIIGNELTRQPNELANTGVTFNYGNFDASLFHNFHGDNFANSGNTVPLDSYSLVRLDLGYTIPLEGDQTFRISANVFNLTDEQGITEGSPRQGNSQSGTPAQFFIGRAILPRRITVRFTYDF